MKRELVVIIMISFIIGAVLGGVVASYITIKAVAEIASNFIEIDQQAIEDALYMYKNNIGYCFGGKR